MKLVTEKVSATHTKPARIKVTDEQGKIRFFTFDHLRPFYASCRDAAILVFGNRYYESGTVTVTQLQDKFQFSL